MLITREYPLNEVQSYFWVIAWLCTPLGGLRIPRKINKVQLTCASPDVRIASWTFVIFSKLTNINWAQILSPSESLDSFFVDDCWLTILTECLPAVESKFSLYFQGFGVEGKTNKLLLFLKISWIGHTL